MTEQQLIDRGFVYVNGQWFKPSQAVKGMTEAQKQTLVRDVPAAISNYENRDLLPGSKPKRPVRNVPIRPASGKEANPSRRKISVVSYRKRLIDPDNLCPKYFIDALRYEKVLAGDTAKHVTVEVSQEKSTYERTEISIEP